MGVMVTTDLSTPAVTSCRDGYGFFHSWALRDIHGDVRITDAQWDSDFAIRPMPTRSVRRMMPWLPRR